MGVSDPQLMRTSIRASVSSTHVNEDSFAHLPQSPGGIQPPTTTYQAQQLSKDILCHEGTSIQSGLSFKCSLLGFSSYLKYYGLKGQDRRLLPASSHNAHEGL